jgi:hypothetical protein
MRAATAAAPVHLVKVNPDYEQVGNYLIALQCAMLLVKWHNPERIPDFMPNEDKVRYIEGKAAAALRRLKMPESALTKYVSFIVRGLLHQLNAVPCSILANEWCYAECHGLRDEQEAGILLDLRRSSASMAPKFKAQAPAEIFDRSAAMSAAFALWWAETSGDRLGLLPYEAAGYLKKGEELIAAMRKIPEDMLAKYPGTVNAWADNEALRAGTGDGLRMDAVTYCLSALKTLRELGPEQFRAITVEIALLGQSGLDINAPTPKYTLKSLPGKFSGMQLVSYMYVVFRHLAPDEDAGIDLAKEYEAAMLLFDGKQPS